MISSDPLARATAPRPRCGLIPPSLAGSLGDEAMVLATLAHLKATGASRVDVFTHGACPGSASLPHLVDRDFAVDSIDIGELTMRAPSSVATLVEGAAATCDRFYVLGADVLDGYYSLNLSLSLLAMLAAAARRVADVTVLGFSVNEQPAPACLEALAALPAHVRLCARDPISQQRLASWLKRPVALVADTAFLLQPAGDAPAAHTALGWIEEQRAAGRLILGVNISAQSRGAGQGDAALVTAASHALATLHARLPGCAVLLIPHDTRGQEHDRRIAAAILDALPASLQRHAALLESPYTAGHVKFVCRHLDLVLTSRMHLAIAALGQGTPAVGIPYQGKFEGLFAHFDLPDCVIPPGDLQLPDRLAARLVDLLARRTALRVQIERRLPHVMACARANFDHVPSH